MDTDPPDSSHRKTLILTSIFIVVSTFHLSLALVGVVLLLYLSAMISGSEVALFSLNKSDLEILREQYPKSFKLVQNLLRDQGRLLATILIANNFINIAIVVLSDYLVWNFFTEQMFQKFALWLQGTLPFHLSVHYVARTINFLITVVGVTTLLLLFGEVAPKIYAKVNSIQFAKRMARPLYFLSKALYPLASLFVGLSNKIEKGLDSSGVSGSMTTKDDLDKAISLTVHTDDPDNPKVELLKRILKLDEVTAKQIMTPRVDVLTVDIDDDYDNVLDTVKTSGFSRIPVIEEDFDHVKGILYVKDMLGYLRNSKEKDWRSLINTDIMYVPETKKGNELLKDFQSKHKHIAIVVDEYGGGAGLVTLEDVMEEVIGEIHDEFDEDQEVEFRRLNANTYQFEGKTMLNDVARVLEIDVDEFDAVRGEADSLAGLILEHTGGLPERGFTLMIGEAYKIIVEEVDHRRIKQVKIIVKGKG